MSLRVVLVDDHPVYRQGLALFLAEESITVVAQAATAADGVAAAIEHRPDVVVMDLHLPDRSGVEATRALLAQVLQARVLVLTMDGSDAATVAALRAGARGYLLKAAAPTDVGRAIVAVAKGEMLLDAGLAGRVTRLLSGAAHAAGHPHLVGLSMRELEVLTLVARGLGNAEVGRRLFLAEKTVRNHVTALLAKTGAETRPALVALANGAGISKP